jgi:hypothetical protein
VIILKNKIFLIINILFVLICIGIDVAIGINMKFNYAFYYVTLFFIIGIGIGNLIILIIHLLSDTKYTFNKLIPVMHASYLIIAGIMYYVIEWFKKYEENWLIYWSILGGLIAIDLIIFAILILKKEPQKS